MLSLPTLIQQAQSATLSERHAAFDELTLRYQEMAQRTAYRIVQDRYLAEDIAQEALLLAYQNISQLRDPNAFGAWLRKIVLSQCQRQTRPSLLEPLHDEAQASEQLAPEDWVQQREQRQRIHAAIAALPEHERAVTQGFYLQGESQQELAERLRLPLDTVKKRLQYARQHLRGLMADWNDAVDRAFNDMLQTPRPQRQALYLYRPAPPPTDEP